MLSKSVRPRTRWHHLTQSTSDDPSRSQNKAHGSPPQSIVVEHDFAYTCKSTVVNAGKERSCVALMIHMKSWANESSRRESSQGWRISNRTDCRRVIAGAVKKAKKGQSTSENSHGHSLYISVDVRTSTSRVRRLGATRRRTRRSVSQEQKAGMRRTSMRGARQNASKKAPRSQACPSAKMRSRKAGKCASIVDGVMEKDAQNANSRVCSVGATGDSTTPSSCEVRGPS